MSSKPSLPKLHERLLSGALSAVLVVALGIAALPIPLAHAAPAQGGTLNLLLNYEPPTLVSLVNVATPALSVSAKVTEGLLEYNYDLTPRPQLATSWSISPDGKQYTFHLRKGVKWHDGKDFSSADVAFSILLLKKVHPRGSSTFANVTEVKTPDPYTAIIVLSRPAPYLIKALVATESPIVPKHVYENTDAIGNPNNNAPIGTGPFRFKEWVRGSYIVYERNPDYWDKPKPYVDRIVVKFIPDPAARAIAFETGAVDLGYRTPVPLSDLARLKKVPKLMFETKGNSYSFNVTRLEFNLDNPYFKNLKVRQAVAQAVNRDVVLNTVYYGYGTRTASPIAPGLSAFHDNTPTPYPFDTKAADKLLDEAGYPRKGGAPRFRVTLDYNPISEDSKRLADYLRSALGKVGIDVTIRSQDLPAFVKRIYTERDYDFTVNGASNLFDPTVGVQRLYWSKNFKKGVPFSNATHYSNPEVDKLLEDATSEIDPARRVAQFKQFQQIVGKEVPDLNLVSPQFITIANTRVHDHSLTADGVESNLANVYLDK